MATLVGVLILAAPFAVVAAMMALAERRRARRRDEIVQQITLTDALHAQVGAVVAPIVRKRRRGWRVGVAIPVERPALAEMVLAAAADVFGRAHYEIVLSPQAPVAPAAPAARPAALGQESLSWT